MSADFSSKHIRVCIVDDDEEIGFFLLNIISKMGFEAECFAEAMICLQTVEQQQYDLIITDYYMPKMNGLDLIKNLKEKNLNIPVVLITERGNKELIKEALKEGVVDFLEKPILIEDVHRSVNRGLEKISMNRKFYELRQTYRNLIDSCQLFMVDLSENELKQNLLTILIKECGAHSGSVFGTQCVSKPQLVITHVHNLDHTLVGREVDIGSGVAGWVAQHKEPILIIGNAASNTKYQFTKLSERNLSGNVGSSLVVPLLVKDELQGVICLNRGIQEPSFSAVDLQKIFLFTGTVAANIKLSQLQRELDRLQKANNLPKEQQNKEIAPVNLECDQHISICKTFIQTLISLVSLESHLKKQAETIERKIYEQFELIRKSCPKTRYPSE